IRNPVKIKKTYFGHFIPYNYLVLIRKLPFPVVPQADSPGRTSRFQRSAVSRQLSAKNQDKQLLKLNAPSGIFGFPDEH
ncbi:MAG: hypothetical protein Q7J61_01045, partial [Deltaproteobacteria bacterium]|nr:hypothetical protein [Deltaproteobacteria bacterium]